MLRSPRSGFSGLRVEVPTNKAGGFVEYWSAEGMLEPAKELRHGHQLGRVMSVLALSVVLGVLIALFIKAKWVRPIPGVACVLFGVLVASGPAGPPLQSWTGDAGSWVISSLASR